MTMKIVAVLSLLSLVSGVLSSHQRTQTLGKVYKYALNQQKTAEQISLEEHVAKLLYSSEMKRSLMENGQLADLFTNGNISSRCIWDIEFAVTKNTAWAKNMLDAAAKPPPSIKYGAIHWVGGFEQCMQNKPPEFYNGPGPAPRSHYCRAVFGSLFPEFPTLGVDVGVCIPQTCSATELKNFLNEVIALGSALFPNSTKTQVTYAECLVPQGDLKWSSAAIGMCAFCGVLGALMLIATVYDVAVVQPGRRAPAYSVQSQGPEDPEQADGGQPDQPEDGTGEVADTNHLIRLDPDRRDPTAKIWQKMLVAFSIYTNTLKMMDTKRQPGRLNCLDGIRFLSMSWVILGHTYVFSMFFINNAVYILPVVTKRWTYAAILNGTFSVDSFFLLSGLLTAYMFLKEAHRMGTVAKGKFWILYFFHRYWRLTPPYMLFLGFYTSLVVYVSNGPLWSQTNVFDGSNCRKNWWQNILYINNVFKEDEGCMGWTWYLANDMQFHFIVAPLLLILMFLFGAWGIAACFPVIIGSIITTAVITFHNKKSSNPLVLFTIPDMTENVYFRPWCRVSPYLVGLIAGYLVHEYQKKNWRIHWLVVVVGWVVAAGFCLSTLYGLVGITNGSYTVSDGVSAFYTSTSRFAWSLGLAWIIFACLTGYGGWVDRFLSWKLFMPLSRLTYCAYLVHPVVMFVFLMTMQSSALVTTTSLVYWFFGHMVASYMVAFVLSISCESPLLGLEKILLRRR